MRIAVFVVHTSTLLYYFFYGMFAFRSCLIIRLYSYLTVHDPLDVFGSFALGVYVRWENAVYLAREFGSKLNASDELDMWTRCGTHTFFQNSSTLLCGSCFLTLTGESCTDCGAGWGLSKSAAMPGSLMLFACEGTEKPRSPRYVL